MQYIIYIGAFINIFGGIITGHYDLVVIGNVWLVGAIIIEQIKNK
jgi:hypothetical protein